MTGENVNLCGEEDFSLSQELCTEDNFYGNGDGSQESTETQVNASQRESPTAKVLDHLGKHFL